MSIYDSFLCFEGGFFFVRHCYATLSLLEFTKGISIALTPPGASKTLPNKLGVRSDATYPRLPQVRIGFVDGGHLLEMKHGGVEEEEADEIERPADRVEGGRGPRSTVTPCGSKFHDCVHNL